MTVRFLLDEHVWGGLVQLAVQVGADALLVQTQLEKGASDEDVLVLAASERRILLTSNAQDFAPLAVDWFLAEREHWGIIIVPGQTDKSLLSRAVRNIAQNYKPDAFKNSYRFIQEFLPV
jgi:predicted nuclease of predicted toxin-antitoxin system